tara:strand:- start:303 stop:557 length:255 start_codon:yes stop_codon:yes gene_type:complete
MTDKEYVAEALKAPTSWLINTVCTMEEQLQRLGAVLPEIMIESRQHMISQFRSELAKRGYAQDSSPPERETRRAHASRAEQKSV